ncbi:MAG: hypothetical protein M5U09_27075 [Gammaproteobacteria bacterium]|nr:hypothetical protein [Gammaproteobacteria bacterium]
MPVDELSPLQADPGLDGNRNVRRRRGKIIDLDHGGVRDTFHRERLALDCRMQQVRSAPMPSRRHERPNTDFAGADGAVPDRGLAGIGILEVRVDDGIRTQRQLERQLVGDVVERNRGTLQAFEAPSGEVDFVDLRFHLAGFGQRRGVNDTRECSRDGEQLRREDRQASAAPNVVEQVMLRSFQELLGRGTEEQHGRVARQRRKRVVRRQVECLRRQFRVAQGYTQLHHETRYVVVPRVGDDQESLFKVFQVVLQFVSLWRRALSVCRREVAHRVTRSIHGRWSVTDARMIPALNTTGAIVDFSTRV